MATFYQRGTYQWEASIRRKGFPVQRKTFNTKRDAEDWAREVERAMRVGQFVPMGKSEKVTFGELIDRYIREVTPTKKNWKSETEILGRIKKRLGEYSLVSITSEMLASFRDDLLKKGKQLADRQQGPLASSSVNHYLNAISVVIDMAMKEWGYPLPANPVRDIKRPAPAKGRDRRLRPGEEHRIMKECRRYKSPVLEPLARLAIETAMRQGELFALTWNDVDLRKRFAVLRDTKNGETRAVPLSPTAAMILQLLRDRKGKGKVFDANIAATRIAFTRAVERARDRYVAACRRIGREPDGQFLIDITFHDLRHEATSRLFERGVFDVMEVASITGHKTLAMLKRYTHLRAENLAKKLI